MLMAGKPTQPHTQTEGNQICCGQCARKGILIMKVHKAVPPLAELDGMLQCLAPAYYFNYKYSSNHKVYI